MKLIQNSNFRVQGIFFNNCIEKNQIKTHFEEGTSESLYYLAIIPPRIYATKSIIKNLQYNFPKMRGGSKAVCSVSKKSSDLVAGPFSNQSNQPNQSNQWPPMTYFWRFLFISGYFWLFLTISNYLWLLLAIFGYFWLFLTDRPTDRLTAWPLDRVI